MSWYKKANQSKTKELENLKEKFSELLKNLSEEDSVMDGKSILLDMAEFIEGLKK